MVSSALSVPSVPRRTRPCRRRARPARGEVTLIVLIGLVVVLLGLVYTMRDTLFDSAITGNNLARQRAVQVSDIGLRMLEAQVLAAYGGRALELSAYTQPWWRDVAAGTAPPDETYWANCPGNADATLRCSNLALTVNGTALPYGAKVLIQPTGRVDPAGCPMLGFKAVYYDMFIHVDESNLATSATTETVYKLCVY